MTLEIIALAASVPAAVLSGWALAVVLRTTAAERGRAAEHKKLKKRFEDCLAAVNGYRGAGERK